jgi:signal recognition particle subunit SEC65
MAVYVDSEEIRSEGRIWCHLVADSIDELHSFAARLGLQRKWFQSNSYYPHYDVTLSVRFKAVELGAINADRRQIIVCCKQMRAQIEAEKLMQLSLFD